MSEPSRLDQLLDLWLKNDLKGFKGGTKQEDLYVNGLYGGTAFLDQNSHTGKRVGTIAIKFGGVVLINTDPKVQAMRGVVRRAARRHGYNTIDVKAKHLLPLRSYLRSDKLPDPRQARHFRKALPENARTFFPEIPKGSSNDLLAMAHVVNTFQHNNKMKCVLMRVSVGLLPGRYVAIEKFYASADDAVLDYMKMTNPAEYKIVEI